MADIQFGNPDAGIQRVYYIAHLVASVLCVMLGVLSILSSEHTLFLPAFFLIGGVVSIISALERWISYRRNKKRVWAGIGYFFVGLALFFITYVAYVCFWA